MDINALLAQKGITKYKHAKMKNILKAVAMIVSIFVMTYSCTPIANGSIAYPTDSDVIIYTVERVIFLGHFETSTDQDIIFTKVFSKNESNQEIVFLFELQEKIYDCRIANGDIYLLATSGIYICSINGENLHLLIGGEIKSFTLNDNSIFYCLYNDDIMQFQIIKCDLNSNNEIVLAEKISAYKLTAINDDLIYSDTSSAGKISGTDHVTFITNFEVPMPGGWEQDGGRHYVIDNKIIISGYAAPEEYREYGRYPTIILDLNGKAIDVWENCFVRYITKVDDIIYAVIDNMLNDGGGAAASSDTYRITDDFTDKQLSPDEVLRDRTTANITTEQYTDTIVAVILRENTTGSFGQYCSELVAFDVPPVKENDHVLVPMRAIFEAAGATVDWDNYTQTVTAKKDDTEISLKIGSNVLYKNGEEIALDATAKIVNNRTLVPISAISEGLNARVEWKETEKAVLIWDTWDMGTVLVS